MSGRALQILIALILAGLWGAGLGALHWQGGIRVLERAEAALTDVRTLLRGRKPAPDAVTIIAIDDETAQQAGGYPVSRATLARIINAAASMNPKAIAVDVLLLDPGPETGDAALTQTLRKTGAIIAAAAVYADDQQATADSDGPLASVPKAEKLLLPVERFASAARLGVVNVVTDSTGTPRFFPMLFRTGDQLHASLVLQAATVARGEDPVIAPNSISMGGRTIRTDIGHVLPIDFYGPSGTIKTVSAAAALNGQLTRDDIQGRIVVIGATVTGAGDVFHTPFDPVLPGVEVIATAISHLMTGDGLARDKATRLADAGVAVVLPIILVGLLAWRRSVIGFAAIACVVAMWLTVNVFTFSRGLWLSAALPMAAAVPPVLLFGAAQIWLGRRRAQHFERESELLQHFQAPVVSSASGNCIHRSIGLHGPQRNPGAECGSRTVEGVSRPGGR
jgi:adenylate cyclase